MKTILKLLFQACLVLFLAAGSMAGLEKPALKKKSVRQYDAALMISPVTLMQKIKQKERLFLVDIRHEKEYSRFKLPGSINIPLAFVKTKPFLKTHPMILIQKSIAYSGILSRAEQLKKDGFDIKILQGGLAAWKHKGGKLVGDPFSSRSLNRISVKTFIEEKDHEEWAILNAGSKPSNIQKKMLPKAMPTPVKKIPDTLCSIFSNPLLTTAVIFTQTGTGYANIEKEIDPVGCQNQIRPKKWHFKERF